MAREAPRIPLPKRWPGHVKSGILHVIALAHVALTAARARATKRLGIVARLRAKVEESIEEISRLREELSLEDLRMSRMMLPSTLFQDVVGALIQGKPCAVG